MSNNRRPLYVIIVRILSDKSSCSMTSAIVVIILSSHFHVEIGVVDVASGNVHIYGNGDRRIYLLYDGEQCQRVESVTLWI